MIATPYLWLLIFFLIPFFIVFKLSLSDVATAIPPYTPTFSWSGSRISSPSSTSKTTPSFSAIRFTSTPTLSSLKIAAISTFLTLLVAYPMAYGMARAPKGWQPTLMMLVILPFWTSFLIRIYAWIAILKPEGFLTLLLTEARSHYRAPADHEHDDGRLHRHRLFVPAVHDPAALCQP